MRKIYKTQKTMNLKRILLLLSAIACLSVNAQEATVPTWKIYLENLKKGWTPDNYKGDMKELIQFLTQISLTDITITEPDLNEIFMHFYE